MGRPFRRYTAVNSHSSVLPVFLDDVKENLIGFSTQLPDRKFGASNSQPRNLIQDAEESTSRFARSAILKFGTNLTHATIVQSMQNHGLHAVLLASKVVSGSITTPIIQVLGRYQLIELAPVRYFQQRLRTGRGTSYHHFRFGSWHLGAFLHCCIARPGTDGVAQRTLGRVAFRTWVRGGFGDADALS